MEEAFFLGGKSGGGRGIKLAIRLSKELVPTSSPTPVAGRRLSGTTE